MKAYQDKFFKDDRIGLTTLAIIAIFSRDCE